MLRANFNIFFFLTSVSTFYRGQSNGAVLEAGTPVPLKSITTKGSLNTSRVFATTIVKHLIHPLYMGKINNKSVKKRNLKNIID